jgi:hypothetical protein
MIVRNGPDARQRLDMDDNLVRLGPAGVVRARHKSQKNVPFANTGVSK